MNKEIFTLFLLFGISIASLIVAIKDKKRLFYLISLIFFFFALSSKPFRFSWDSISGTIQIIGAIFLFYEAFRLKNTVVTMGGGILLGFGLERLLTGVL